MTEQPTTTVTNTETPIDTTISAVPSAPVSPPLSQQPPVTTDVDPSDGKPWRTKFHGQKGAYEQLKNQVAAKEGALSEQIKQLQQSLQVSEAEVQRLTIENTKLQGQADAIPQLQTDNQNLKQEAAIAERMKVLLDYPAVLGMQVEEEVPATEEGQEATTIKVNPILNLVANSNLDVDALKAEIERIAKFQGAAPQAPPEEPTAGPPVAPAPASPSEETPEYWHKRALEIDAQMSSEGMSPQLVEASKEAWRKHAELGVAG